MHLSFALGKAYGDLKEVNPSFTHYLEGNRLRRKEVKYDSAAIKAYFNEIKSIYTPDYAAQAPTSGIHDDTPIFILGQPRSGTTLVEQILASHPDVFGAEELHYMGTIANTFCHRELGRMYPTCMKQAKADDLAKIGKEYLRLLRTHSVDAKHITDKMPANFQYVGMILQSLPNARIIHCHRNPMDNCFSIFKYYFVGSINYAYDLKELGEYYLLYRDLMDHWHSVYPGRIFDLEYEEMTRDAENLIQSIMNEVDTLTEMSDEYLRFARFPRLETRPASINDVLIELTKFFNKEMSQRGISLKENYAPNLPQILLDTNQIKQAFLNILKNSSESMPDGGKLSISTRLKGDNIDINITDTGSGINRSDIRRVFDPFYSTKVKGTGLGLALTMKTVEGHGGDIICKSTINKGTTMTVSFPAKGCGEERIE